VIDLVVFDLGRVLIRICDGWKHACENAGVTIPADISPETRARLLQAVVQIEIGQMEVDAFCAEAAQCLGIPCDAVLRMWKRYTLGPYEGAAELIADLNAAGLATACLSNTNVQHWQILEDPADPHFEPLKPLTYRFASHLIGARKPDPAIYAHVEQATNIHPTSILFFDDVEENITAAQARGWKAHLVPRCANPIPGIREQLTALTILK
jgi:HAD superfamily hydrolase (TIGR01509 family)